MELEIIVNTSEQDKGGRDGGKTGGGVSRTRGGGRGS